ncbi:MAG: tRNA (cytidine(34)-2'-O)-methyltransferase [Desulfobacter sp.]|nr:tRNA (cytidine(34)-2'-O)-methyltransferase [Desulfobacter sp.]WDP88094.1 MAG: tRNA (cytidine(34)-2'-O)-methyltransferase [Desulfobacter sp.]
MVNLNIVLLEPEIPQNTGNIGRTCNAMGASLHLIEPLGFSIEDKYLRRAGLDYWKNLKVKTYTNFKEYLARNPQGQKVFLSKKASVQCDLFPYSDHVHLIFGKESKGLPEKLLLENKDACVRVPMFCEARSFNLANTVAILSYEVMRQHKFAGLKIEGIL